MYACMHVCYLVASKRQLKYMEGVEIVAEQFTLFLKNRNAISYGFYNGLLCFYKKHRVPSGVASMYMNLEMSHFHRPAISPVYCLR